MGTWAYKRNEKVAFLTALNTWKNRLAACFLYNIGIAFVSECPCHLTVQYAVNSQIFVVVTDFTL